MQKNAVTYKCELEDLYTVIIHIIMCQRNSNAFMVQDGEQRVLLQFGLLLKPEV